MTQYVNVNGAVVAADQARLSALNRGALYGDGLFETMLAWRGTVFRLDAHLRRLFDSAGELMLNVGVPAGELSTRIDATLAANGLGHARVRLTAIRGGEPGMAIDRAEPAVIIIQTTPVADTPHALHQTVRCIVSRIRRSPDNPVVRHKTLNYLPSLLAHGEACAAGADDAIFLNSRGELAEGCTSNLFLVRGGRVFTPPLDAGILPGTVREVVLQECTADGIPASEAVLTLDDLAAADEVFLSSSIRGIAAASDVSGCAFSDAPGPVTRRLHQLYWRRVDAECPGR